MMSIMFVGLALSAVAHAIPSMTVSTRAPQPALTVDVRCGWSIDPVDLGEFADPKVELTLASNTPAVCVSECTTRGYSLAAVEYGDQCSCGNAYIDDIPPTSAGSWNCKYPCAGDEAQFCGGWNFKMVYRTSLYQSPSGSSSLPATATSSTGSPQATIPVDVACGIVIGINGLFDVDLLQDNTPAVCVQQCANIGLRIAALTGGYWCYCMNSSSYNGVPPVSLPVSECNVPCEGDPTQMCGGLEASTFYRTPIYK